jgi:hypothetical protein
MADRILIGLLDFAMALGVVGIVLGLFTFRKRVEMYREIARKRLRD